MGSTRPTAIPGRGADSPVAGPGDKAQDHGPPLAREGQSQRDQWVRPSSHTSRRRSNSWTSSSRDSTARDKAGA
jgi:hypothetical protein